DRHYCERLDPDMHLIKANSVFDLRVRSTARSPIARRLETLTARQPRRLVERQKKVDSVMLQPNCPWPESRSSIMNYNRTVHGGPRQTTCSGPNPLLPCSYHFIQPPQIGEIKRHTPDDLKQISQAGESLFIEGKDERILLMRPKPNTKCRRVV